jgi:hypothetical protein
MDSNGAGRLVGDDVESLPPRHDCSKALSAASSLAIDLNYLRHTVPSIPAHDWIFLPYYCLT